MAKGAGYGIPIAFVIPIVFGIGSQNGCNFVAYTGFFGNTGLHFLLLNLRLQSRNLEVGIEMKSLGVMNGGCFATKTQRRKVFQDLFLVLPALVCGHRMQFASDCGYLQDLYDLNT